jgi:glycogenin glucosyltransferase
MHEQSWVTLALSDTNAWQALVLAKSLRRSFTTRKLTIVISENVSQPMKVFLQKEFDMVTRFDTSELELRNGKLNKDLAKLWPWNLKAWEKCVFLNSNSIVLKNADILFENEELSACPSESIIDRFNTDLFLFRPSSETFALLMKAAENVKGTAEDVLNQYYGTWKTSTRNHIDSSFSTTIDELEKGGLSPSIIRFTTLPWNIDTKNYRSKDIKVRLQRLQH